MRDLARKKLYLVVETDLRSEALAMHTASGLWQNLVA